ncbi:MAG: hypothetical protein RIR69_1607 [Actinomycetota bacterium]
MLVRAGLVSEPLKILYVPVTKVACSSLKLMIATAGGTFNEEMINKLDTRTISRTQTIHDRRVSGFLLYRELTEADQNLIYDSPDWWRVGAVRNPYARIYSTFENRVLMLMRGVFKEIAQHFELQYRDGNIDITESFHHFVRTMRDHRDDFWLDDHFRPQYSEIHPDLFPYTHFFKVDDPGAMDGFAAELSTRSGKQITAVRLNEGLGIKYKDVMTAPIARIIEELYPDDFAKLGYAHEEFPDDIEHIVASRRETTLLHYSYDLFERLGSLSDLAKKRLGARTAARAIANRIVEKLRGVK